jgi:hypothetical protein
MQDETRTSDEAPGLGEREEVPGGYSVGDAVPEMPPPSAEEEPDDTALDSQTDGDRQLTTDSEAIDEGGTNDSDLGAGVAGDIGPKHED